MKTKILLAALVLLGSTSTLLAGNCIDKLSRSITRLPNVEKVTLTPLVLNLIKPFSPEMKGINSMNMLNAEELSTTDYNQLKKLLNQCNDNGYETLVSTNEEDEIARILMKIEKEKIREIIIISLEKDEVSFIRIKGAIDPDQLNAIIENNK